MGCERLDHLHGRGLRSCSYHLVSKPPLQGCAKPPGYLNYFDGNPLFLPLDNNPKAKMATAASPWIIAQVPPANGYNWVYDNDIVAIQPPANLHDFSFTSHVFTGSSTTPPNRYARLHRRRRRLGVHQSMSTRAVRGSKAEHPTADRPPVSAVAAKEGRRRIPTHPIPPRQQRCQ